MKFSGRLVIPSIFILMVYMAACGKSSEQPVQVPSGDSGQKPPAVSTDTAHGDDHKNDVVSGLYANDLGSAKVEEGRIPQNLRKGYDLLRMKCAKCHSVARPLNAQYLEADELFQSKLLAMNPKALDDSRLLKLESDAWRRMVKRMMAKPGNDINTSDAKEIHAFLVWLYLDRVGTNGVAAESWINHRKELLEEFKKKYPARYKDLYGK